MTTKISVNLQKALHPKQLEVYKALDRFNVIVAGRRFGKTRLGVFKIFYSALTKRGVYWWVSPTSGVGLPAWRLMKLTFQKTFGDKAGKINETLREIYLPNGSYIQFKSADNPDSLRGEGLSGLVMDESASIKEEVWSVSLRPALMDNLGWAILIGTPKGLNYFYDIYYEAINNRNEFKAFHLTSYDNPILAVEEIEVMKKNMTKLEFDQEVMGEFIFGGGLTFKKEWFETRLDNPEYIARFFSWDTASTAFDTSAYTVGIVGDLMPDYRIYIRYVFRDKIEFPQLEYKITDIYNQFSNETRAIVIENKSSGISVLQSLKQTLPPEVSRMLVGFNPKGEKEARATLAAKWCEKDCVRFPTPNEKNDWLFFFEEELFTFPNSKYRDCVDAFGQLLDYVSNYLQEGLTYR